MTTEETRLTSARQHLRRLDYQYSGRRPASETLLKAFAEVLDEAETEIQKKISEAEHDAEMRQEGRLQQAVKREDDARNLAESMRQEVARLREVLADKRALQEEREREGDDVKVSIDRGVGGWTVADIEEIAYRLRGGGAVDDTPVHLSTTRVVSHVPDPNVVTLGSGQEIEHPHPATMTAEAGLPWRRREAFLLVSCVLAAIIGILGLTVW